MAVGEVWWEDASEPEWSHLLALGPVEVPDGTAVRLSVRVLAEVGVFVGDQERVTWQKGMPDSVLRNTRSIWGKHSYYISAGDGGVDLEFIRGLPRDSVFDLSVDGEVVPAGSFAAVAHLAPGLQNLSVSLNDLSPDAPSVIAELTALQSLVLSGTAADEDGPAGLDDHALSVIADLPAIESLTLVDGAYTEHGLHQLGRLQKLRHLHVEREGLTASMFQFAATMPSLTRLSGVNESLDEGPMSPAEVAHLRAMLPHVIVG
jgi:hypothetical protein